MARRSDDDLGRQRLRQPRSRPAIAAPSTTWYLAEGSTSGEFALFYLLQNPQATAVTATVRYLRPFGAAADRADLHAGAASRTTILVDDEGAGAREHRRLGGRSPRRAPIVAERAMYLQPPGPAVRGRPRERRRHGAGHDWFLAEGATGTVLRSVRPDRQSERRRRRPSTSTICCRAAATLTKTYTVPARVADHDLGRRRGAAGRLRPEAARERQRCPPPSARPTPCPIIVERTMWWPGPATDRQLLVRGAQLARARRRRRRGGCWRKAKRRPGRRRDLRADRQHVRPRRPGARASIRRRDSVDADRMTGRSAARRAGRPCLRTDLADAFPTGAGSAILVEALGQRPGAASSSSARPTAAPAGCSGAAAATRWPPAAVRRTP